MKARNESDAAMSFIKLILQKMLSIKYLYVASFVLIVAAAFLYNKYSAKVYELSSIIGPVKDSRSAALASNDMFSGYGTTFSTRDLEAVINGLNSFSLVSQTVNDLDLEIGYFSKPNSLFKQFTEIYLQSPFVVNLDKSHIQPIYAMFYVTVLNDSTFRLTASEKEAAYYNYIDNEIIADEQLFTIDTICRFNQIISNWNCKFSITPRKDLLLGRIDKNMLYSFVFYHPEQLAKYYMKNLKIEPVSWMASIIKVQFSSENLKKSLNFLNSFVNSFLEDNLAKKNRIAKSTISFIDNMVSGMSDSLANSESTLRSYKSSSQSVDLSLEGQRLFNQLTAIEDERTTLELQSRYYNYVLNFFKTNQDISGITLPSTAKINDPVFNNLFSEIFTLSAEKSSIANNNEKNVFSAQIENKIKVQKQTLVENITNNLNTLNLTLNELNYKAEKIRNNMANLPGKELNMVNIQRKFDLNNTIYTYLLQKRSEAAITLSSNYPDYEILEPAREITSEIVRPKKFMIYIVAIFLAFLIPTLYLIFREFFNDNLGSIHEIGNLTDRAIIGTIYKNNKDTEAVVTELPASAISESFRNLRSSLLFILNSHPTKVVLITSSQPQDGKSFISFNLAASIASVGFRTILLDCDLRRPQLHLKFKMDNTSGITNYMVKHSSIDEIIKDTGTENLSFISAGPLLPNPSELISAGILDDFFEILKSKFDFIIIDTAPIGLVSESIQLMKYASNILLVTRINQTKKEILSNALDSLDSNKINNYEIVVNDVNLEKSPYSGYKNYYQKG